MVGLLRRSPLPIAQPHQRAAVRGRLLGDDRAAVRLGDLLHDREAEARARACCAPTSRGRSARRRAAGRPRRCPGRGRARSARRRASATSTGAPDGLHFAALSSRFAIARSRLAGVPTIVDRGEVGVDRHVGVVPRRAPDRVLGERGRAAPPRARAAAPRRARARSARRSASVISRELRDDVGEELLALVRRQRAAAGREHLDVRAQARERRPQLVRGVLDELALALRASSSDSSIALKVEASRLSSSLPVHLDPLRQVARRAHVLGRRRSGRAPASAPRARRGSRRRARSPIAAERDEQQPEPDLRELVVDVRRASVATCDRVSAWSLVV